MSFKRHDIKEEYNTTADWLQDFARQLEKKSYNIENLTNIRQMNDGPKKFATIEEKMADIKQRIGFETIKKMHEDSGLKDKVAGHDCGCKGSDPTACACEVKTASEKKHKEEDLKLMKVILDYIVDLCEHEHETLSPVMVISKCRDEAGLHFDDLPINTEKLKEFISNTLDKYSSDEEVVKYIPRDDALDQSDKNPEAEYWSHANPTKG